MDKEGKFSSVNTLNRPEFMDPKYMILTLITHDIVKQNNSEFADQLDQFSNALNGATAPTALANKYGYTAPELLKIKNDAAYFRFWFTKQGAGDTYKLAWTAKGKEIRKGDGSSASAFPEGADVSGAPTAVLPGVEGRFREMAKKAKSQTSIYNVNDGIAMGIETSSSQFNPADGKPVLKISVSDGGHPIIEYVKSKYQGINIYVDRGDDAGFKFMVTCNDPSCTDLAPLPAVGKSALWTYRALYLYAGRETGTVSLDTPISVTGIH